MGRHEFGATLDGHGRDAGPGGWEVGASGVALHERLLRMLAEVGVAYRMVRHATEGRTEAASRLRGHPLRSAAKAMVVGVKLRKHSTFYVLVVVRGDREIDMPAVARLYGGKRAGLAPPHIAIGVTGCPMGAVPPFSFRDDLPVVMDEALAEEEVVVFSAATLECTIFMNTGDYIALAKPQIHRVARAASSCEESGNGDAPC